MSDDVVRRPAMRRAHWIEVAVLVILVVYS